MENNCETCHIKKGPKHICPTWIRYFDHVANSVGKDRAQTV
jgi:hypothetical protein